MKTGFWPGTVPSYGDGFDRALAGQPSRRNAPKWHRGGFRAGFAEDVRHVFSSPEARGAE